jgi:hypothetical protein
MGDNDDPEKTRIVTAGYTYLGQFIDHDLTRDITPLDRAQSNADHTRNFRTAFLDLDHLYAGGPNLSRFLYMNDEKCRGRERFLIGKTRKPNGEADKEEDLPRNPEGVALVGDARQDENLIIAQLHVVFLKFHNYVIEDLEDQQIESVGPAGASIFEQARRFVTWYYQRIVINEFLRLLVDAAARKEIARRCKEPANASGRFLLPIEFSAAAFRFGHSMVRDSYDYNQTHHQNEATLEKLLALTGTGLGAAPALPADWVIHWPFFFYVDVAPHNIARDIDTKIANGLQNVPPAAVKLFTAAPPDKPSGKELPLPVKTLLRGARMGLPSGQDVARALALEPLDSATIANGPHRKILEDYGFHKDTPLWYYILKEAEILAEDHTLGAVGSRIVADVIVSALQADPNSYLSNRPDWNGGLPGVPTNTKPGTMRQLLSYVLKPRKKIPCSDHQGG